MRAVIVTTFSVLLTALPSLAGILDLYNRKPTDNAGDSLCPPPRTITLPNQDGRVMQQPWDCYPKQLERYTLGTVCISRCFDGAYAESLTEATIKCEAHSSHPSYLPHWNALPLHCLAIECKTSEINPMLNGRWQPEKCMLQRTVLYDTQCRLVCNPLFVSRSESTSTTCQANGWSVPKAKFECIHQYHHDDFHHGHLHEDYDLLHHGHMSEHDPYEANYKQIEGLLLKSLQSSQKEKADLLDDMNDEDTKKTADEVSTAYERVGKFKYPVLADDKDATHTAGDTQSIANIIKAYPFLLVLILGISLTVVIVAVVGILCYINCRKPQKYMLMSQMETQLVPVSSDGKILQRNNNNSHKEHRQSSKERSEYTTKNRQTIPIELNVCCNHKKGPTTGTESPSDKSCDECDTKSSGHRQHRTSHRAKYSQSQTSKSIWGYNT